MVSTALEIVVPLLFVGLVYIVYRLLRVPDNLRPFPSVPIYKLVKWAFWSTTPRAQYLEMRELLYRAHEVYRIWNFGRWKLIFNNPDHIHQIYRMTNSAIDKVPLTSAANYSAITAFLGNGIIFAGLKDWHRIRKVVNPAFAHPWSTEEFGMCMQRLVQTIRRRVPEKGALIRVDRLIKRVTLDIFGKVLINYDFNCVEKPDSPYAAAIIKIMDEITMPLFSAFPFLDLIPGIRRAQLYRDIATFDELLFSLIQPKLNQRQQGKPLHPGKKSSDLLDMMLDASDANDADRLSPKELRDNLTNFFVAGFDTSAASINHWLFILAKNPRVQAKARLEVLEAMGDELPWDAVPTAEQINGLKYVNATIMENLRYNPPISLTAGRMVVKDCQIGPYHVAKGTALGMHLYALHFDDRLWTDPLTFQPDRFLVADAHGSNDKHNWLPFGMGARKCLGTNFAMHEMRVIATMMLRCFEWSLPADTLHADIRSPAFGTFSPTDVVLHLRARL
ncbi:hypothetical protein H4R35_003608 [Dimargaris xerosporica]|nr:hypothetical protein H4R35_003608 [Dimargaris xerosporica]